MLIAPLDWGLGHASRCVPIIEKLLAAGFKVIIAAEGDQKILLQTEFPLLEMLHLDGYHLQYGSTKWKTILKIIFQSPAVLTSIIAENKWLQNVIKEKHLDVVIADNRFGLHNNKVISVFITHQLLIKTSLGKWTDRLLQKMNYHFINRFNYCWVPDHAGETNLAGALSHPKKKPRTPVSYIGILSRIKKLPLPVTNKLLIILSGPEPQRSIIETILLSQLETYALPVILVRGLPDTLSKIPLSASLTVYNYLSAQQLQQVINQSEIILSRSGYSTIMDVLPLAKKCIFIPTPGQAEQEYLAGYLAAKNYACLGEQRNFSLSALIKRAELLQPTQLPFDSISAEIQTAFASLQSSLNSYS